MARPHFNCVDILLKMLSCEIVDLHVCALEKSNYIIFTAVFKYISVIPKNRTKPGVSKTFFIIGFQWWNRQL